LSQSVLFLAIHLLGLAVCFALGPRRAAALSCALAFPTGLAVAVLLALAMLVLGVPYGPWTLCSAMAVVAGAAAVLAARRGLERRDLVVSCWWTAIFAVACVALTHFNVAILGNDSHTILSLSFAIANAGALPSDIIAVLDKEAVFQILAHSMYGVTARDFLYSLPLILGLSFAAMFALTLWHGLDAVGAASRRRSALVALVTAALFTVSTAGWNFLHLHTNLGSAVYLFGYVALFWVAEVKSDPAYLPPAFICLTGFALHRTETPLVALLFLAVTVTQSELPRRAITGWLALFTVVVGFWHERLAEHVSGRGFITPTRGRMVWALLVLFFLWWCASGTRLVRRIDRWVPALVVGVCALALIGAFATRPDHMLRSIQHWAINLTELPLWGHSWFFIPLLILLGLAVRPPPFRVPFAVGLPAYFAFVLLLAYFRIPYRVGQSDSANRMTFHVVPMIFFYLAIKFAACQRPSAGGPAEGANDRGKDLKSSDPAPDVDAGSNLVRDQSG
jgi:hypothetical protein